MKLLGGGPKEWALPTGVLLAAITLPLFVANVLSTNTSAKMLGMYIGELVGALSGATLNRILSIEAGWEANSAIAFWALLGGIFMALTL